MSDAALALLKALPRERDSDLVFLGHRKGTALSINSLSTLLKSLGRSETVHGFRSTFRDFAGERTNFPREVAEQALAHAISSKVEAAYRRGDLLAKRRQLMEAFARYAGSPAATGAVVSLPRAVRS